MSQSITPQIIPFAQIPYTWKVPGNYMEVKPAVNENALLAFPARGLLMGQMYASGTGVAGTVYPLYSVAQANALFGAGSQVARMAQAWLKNNPYTVTDVVGVADASGAAAAAGAVAITGSATQAGTLAIYIGGIRVATPVNVGDTGAVVAANLAAQIGLQGQSGYPYLPSVTATHGSGATSVVLTCGHGGTLGNQIDVRANAQNGDVTPAGLTVTITAMTGGATDPAATVVAALDSLTSTWYTDVAFPWTDTTNIGNFAAWATERYGAMAKQDVQGYASVSGSYGTVLAFEPNCAYISVLPVQNPLTPSWITAAAFAAACCYSTAQVPSLQMKTVPLVDVVAPAQGDQFTLNEREALLEAGLSTYTADTTGTVYLDRVVTTYRTDPGGIPNNAYFDLADTKVPTRVRYDWDSYLSVLYPRNHLCADGTIAAQYDPYAVTPKALQASWAGRCTIYEQNGWIQNSAATSKNSTFVIDSQDGNRVNSRQQIQVMGNLIVLAGSLEFISNN